jgi:hypothetical protein
MMNKQFKNGCECCGGWPVVFVQKCHPEADTIASLDQDGRVTIVCAKCDSFIVDFQTDLQVNREITHESLPGRNVH